MRGAILKKKLLSSSVWTVNTYTKTMKSWLFKALKPSRIPKQPIYVAFFPRQDHDLITIIFPCCFFKTIMKNFYYERQLRNCDIDDNQKQSKNSH